MPTLTWCFFSWENYFLFCLVFLTIAADSLQLKVVFGDGKIMLATKIADKLFKFWSLDGLGIFTADTV